LQPRFLMLLVCGDVAPPRLPTAGGVFLPSGVHQLHRCSMRPRAVFGFIGRSVHPVPCWSVQQRGRRHVLMEPAPCAQPAGACVSMFCVVSRVLCLLPSRMLIGLRVGPCLTAFATFAPQLRGHLCHQLCILHGAVHLWSVQSGWCSGVHGVPRGSVWRSVISHDPRLQWAVQRRVRLPCRVHLRHRHAVSRRAVLHLGGCDLHALPWGHLQQHSGSHLGVYSALLGGLRVPRGVHQCLCRPVPCRSVERRGVGILQPMPRRDLRCLCRTGCVHLHLDLSQRQVLPGGFNHVQSLPCRAVWECRENNRGL
jgi:hypothetical protein